VNHRRPGIGNRTAMHRTLAVGLMSLLREAAILPLCRLQRSGRFPRANSPPDRRKDPRMSQLLTVDDAATTLGTSPRFIRRIIAERRIPYVKLGRHVRIHQSDLDAYIAAGRQEAASLR
jgi:excisionase family DNA binding protein